MGVRHETYIFLAVHLDMNKYSKLSLDEQDKLSELDFPWCGDGAEGQMGILLDGMSSKYWLAGYCWKCSGSEEFGGIPLTYIKDCLNVGREQEVIKWLYSNDLIEYVKGEPIPETLILTHYH